MANKVAIYKQKYFLDNIEHWWEQEVDLGHATFKITDEMYVNYVQHQIKDQEYEAIVSYDDFMRLAYKHGIRRLGTGTENDFVRADSWRPSDDQVMRFTGWSKM